MAPLDRAEDERLVLALRAGDPDAFGRLYDRWYDRVHDLARRITHDDGLAADVAQDAFFAAWQRFDALEDPAAFGGWLLRIARNRALDLVRAPARTRTQVDEDVSATVDEQAVAARLTALADPAEVAADHEVQDLVWSAATVLNERDLTALDLSLRHGLEPAEIGEVLGINRNAANQLVHRMKDRLATAVGSRVLWGAGRPDCDVLRDELAAEGLDEFDARTVRLTDRHAEGCELCLAQRRARLDPAVLFGAVPITIAPVVLKAKAAAALDAAGVPMGGSTALGGSDAGTEGPSDGSGSGGPEAGAEAGPSPSPPDEAAARRHRRRVALAAVAVLVVVGVVTVFAAGLDHDPSPTIEDAEEVDALVPAPSVTDPPPATTTTEAGGISVSIVPDDPAGAPDGGQAPTDDPVATPQPNQGGGGAVPPDPPPPPPAPTASLAVTPGVVPTAHPVAQQATLVWSTTGASSVSVSGPGLSSSSTSGAQSVCPGSVFNGACRTNPGSYTYVLNVSGPGGSTQRTATLTVQ